jgi:hypothetical protein
VARSFSPSTVNALNQRVSINVSPAPHGRPERREIGVRRLPELSLPGTREWNNHREILVLPAKNPWLVGAVDFLGELKQLGGTTNVNGFRVLCHSSSVSFS